MPAFTASRADSPVVWPNHAPAGTRGIPPLGAPQSETSPRQGRPIPPTLFYSRVNQIRFYEDLPAPHRSANAGVPAVEPTPRPQGVWAKLASLNALLEPSPAVPLRRPLGNMTNKPGPSLVEAGEGAKTVGGRAEESWRNHAWLDKLRHDLSLITNPTPASTSTPSNHAHSSRSDAILPPGLIISPPAVGYFAGGASEPDSPSLGRPSPQAPRLSIVPGPTKTRTTYASPQEPAIQPDNPIPPRASAPTPPQRAAPTDGLPPTRHRLRSGGTIEILLAPGQPVLIDLRQQSSRAILIAPASDTVSVFSQLAPGPLVLVAPAAVYARDELPAAYEKVYALAVEFVDSVRGRTPEVIFFPRPPPQLRALSAKCTVFATSAFSVAVSSRSTPSLPPILVIHIDKHPRCLSLSRPIGSEVVRTGDPHPPDRDLRAAGAPGPRETAVKRCALPDTEVELAKLGLPRAESDLIRWAITEVAAEAERLLAQVRRSRRLAGGRAVNAEDRVGGR